ncbi:MAG: hypothetical protein KBD25_00195 [Rickettsiaceae bacterium]|nr:hypothetical protein [Rickettsiaceae bacterium]
MTNKMIISHQPNGGIELVINALEGREGFDQLLNYLVNILSARIIDSTDGKYDTRKCRLSYKGVEIEISYDTLFGNCIIAESLESKRAVLEVADKLEDWL